MGTCTDLKMVIGYRTYKSIIIGETEVFLSKRDSTYNLVDSIKLEMSLWIGQNTCLTSLIQPCYE